MLLGSVLAIACGGKDAEGTRTDAAADQQDASRNEGGSVNDGAARDASSPSHDAAAPSHDGAAPTCSEQIGSCRAQSIAKWKVLLDAADFGAGAHLIALGGQAVLAALGDGSFRVVLIDDNYDGVATTTYSSWVFPGGVRTPVAVSEGANAAGNRLLFVLACEQERANCAVSRAAVSGKELSAWQNTDLPSGFVAHGLVFDAAAEPTAVCVYGNGLVCLNNGWQEAIGPEPELRLNDVFISGLWSLAIGDDGRWFKREAAESGTLSAWQEQPTLAGAALAHASVSRAGAVIVGEGKLQAALGEQAQYFACAPGDLLALSLDDASPGLAYAVTRSGEVLQHPPPRLRPAEPFCLYEQLPAGTVLDVSRSYCLDSVNPRVLLDNVVFGQNLCLQVF